MSDHVRNSVINFLNLLAEDPEDYQNREGRLIPLLDQLALAAQYPGVEPEGDVEDAPPMEDEDELRERLVSLFPHFGLYNCPLHLIEDIGETPMGTGDAIDDLLEITREITEVAWHYENSEDPEVAVWLLSVGFLRNWGKPLRALQLYLHCLLTESKY